ncbi:hypothetical protein DZC78_08320 [Olleya aquimaris]|nr:hypothetical protein DZC78_08320 [Olleya aquimaris]
MYQYYPNLDNALQWIECLSAIVAAFYLPKLKHNYWKWFAIYLIFICAQELFVKYLLQHINFLRKQDYYAFFGIPIQYLFFYWLYALKSLKNKKLFIFSSSIYLLSLIPFEIYEQKIKTISTINLTVGSVFIIILVVLEFIKQIKNDDILKFKENKMFYINTGMILFYVGTYPFSAFYDELLKKPNISIWNMYYLYFLISNCIMYLLFIASFIWGKHKS